MDWIRKQALWYRNLALTGKYQAVVHLEDKEDELFWDYQLQHAKPGRYRFLYYSKSGNGTDTRGCDTFLLHDQIFYRSKIAYFVLIMYFCPRIHTLITTLHAEVCKEIRLFQTKECWVWK